MLKYEVVIYWSKEDRAYLAEIPELPGCIADGETPQNALKNITKVAKEWIDIAKELGRKIPEPKGKLMYA